MKIKEGLKKYQDLNKLFMKELLKNTDLTECLSDDTIEELSYGMKPLYVENGSFLFKEGDYVSRIYFVVSGHLSITLRLDGLEAEVEDLY